MAWPDAGSAADVQLKQAIHTLDVDGADDGADQYHASHGFTPNDRKDMSRMGKTQELRVYAIRHSAAHISLTVGQRDFRPLSALSFTVILQGTWEVLLV